MGDIRQYILRALNHGFRAYLVGEVLYRSRFLESICFQQHCEMDSSWTRPSNRIAIILDKKEMHNHAWHGGDQGGGINVGTPSLSHLMKENRVHVVDETMNGVPYGHGCPSSSMSNINLAQVPPPIQVEDANYVANSSR
ncbi:hypothetical protein HAX54_041891 [Datura stramonium]|uniref:Uncharacterized protein n=1 Tax=Datura stramonium TaxID=4076 RepID=A0ABS8W065_DATST|nr:hypothetical protein [Datura stramonium]